VTLGAWRPVRNGLRRDSAAWSARDRTLVGLALAMLLGPPLLDLLINGWKRVFSYFAADTFYYLTVARNLALQGSPSFDQERATNGFHPLWQLQTGLLYKLTAVLHLSDSVFLVLVFLSCLGLLSLALVVLANCFRLALGRVPTAFPLLPMGLYALTMWPIETQYGSLWSYANGMESSLTIAAFAWVLLSLVRREASGTVANSFQLSIALSALMLSRLDHGVLALCVFAFYFLRDTPLDRPRLVRFLALTVPFTAVFGAYLAFNWLSAGSMLPISGTLKSTAPHPSDVNYQYLTYLFNTPDFPVPGPWAHAQIYIPAAVAGLALLWLLGQWLQRRDDLLTGPLIISAALVLLLAAYNFLFVNLWHQGHWYFPASVLLTTLLVLYLWERHRPIQQKSLEIALAGGAVVLVVAFFTTGYHDSDYYARYGRMFETRTEIAAYFNSEQPKIIEYDDGIVAFTTEFPAMSGFGFTLDQEALSWKRRGLLLWLAYDRGFEYIASMNYFASGGLSTQSDADEIRQKLGETFFLTPREVEPFDFKVAYLTSGRELAIIKMELRDCPPAPVLRGCPAPRAELEPAR
jgi:hypothetical protein